VPKSKKRPLILPMWHQIDPNRENITESRSDATQASTEKVISREEKKTPVYGVY
jgi:hypothetical protein